MTTMSTPPTDMVTLFAQVPSETLPEPGTWVAVTMSNGMVAQLWNLRDGAELTEVTSHSLRYVPVTTVSSRQRVVHAGINRRINGRNRTMESTICSRPGDERRVVAGIVPGSLDDTVTCEQCRKQLIADGAI